MTGTARSGSEKRSRVDKKDYPEFKSACIELRKHGLPEDRINTMLNGLEGDQVMERIRIALDHVRKQSPTGPGWTESAGE